MNECAGSNASAAASTKWCSGCHGQQQQQQQWQRTRPLGGRRLRAIGERPLVDAAAIDNTASAGWLLQSSVAGTTSAGNVPTAATRSVQFFSRHQSERVMVRSYLRPVSLWQWHVTPSSYTPSSSASSVITRISRLKFVACTDTTNTKSVFVSQASTY